MLVLLLLISRLINRSGLRIFHSKVYSSGLRVTNLKVVSPVAYIIELLCKVVELSMQCCGKLLSDYFKESFQEKVPQPFSFMALAMVIGPQCRINAGFVNKNLKITPT